MDALQAYLDSVRETPFKWGEHDCCMFPALATDARVGSHYADAVAEFGITSAIQYRRFMRGKTLESVVRGILGEPVAGDIHRGDMVLIEHEGIETLGIAAPPVVLAAFAVGYAALPLSLVRVTWRPE